MPRLLGIDIPTNKRVDIALQTLQGIGSHVSKEICQKASIDAAKPARELTDEELARIASLLDTEYVVEGQLRRTVQQDINRLKEIGCYRGLRHRRSLPCRGQRTRTNSRTRKGPKKTVAGKKGVKDLR
ncbi:30S ribosomal protein S13 [Planctomycetes bacterium Pan216]|uniref:Small ribosomal subunit protein uS13 n=1 Tax=Kolteria novifilia TaxID=2527975 RepID=A0A518AZP2_9BACT|nr:30S ribosomal protein S13 [Planctomycetes bacterium Pan216]